MFSNKIIISADIHWEENKEHIIEYAVEQLLNTIKKTTPLFVILAGDYFNSRMNADSKTYKKAINYLIEFKKYCKYLIVIKGTHSHDADMLDILKEFNKLDSNILYFDKFTLKEIENIKFAFIPEEYPENFKEYYAPLFQEKVDYIIGHGMIEGAKLHEGIVNKFIKDLKWNAKRLSENSKYTIFGHVHLPQQLESNVFYVGSLARFKFGEEHDKGFIIIDLNNNELNFNIIDNYEFITFIEKKDEFEFFEELVKNEKIYLRYIGEKDSEILKKFLKITKNPIKFVPQKNKKIEIESNILYKEIIDKPIEEQYLSIIEEQSKNLTKKKKALLFKNKENIKKIIREKLNKYQQ